MFHINIQPLSNKNKLEAVEVVLESKVGPRARALRFFNKSLRNKIDNVFLAYFENKVVGLIGWYQDKGEWAGKSLGKLFPYGDKIYWVSYFGVREKFKNKGIGTQLIKKLFEEMKIKKAKELWVYTSRAKGFYEKMGFKFMTRARIESKPHDFLRCRKFNS